MNFAHRVLIGGSVFAVLQYMTGFTLMEIAYYEFIFVILMFVAWCVSDYISVKGDPKTVHERTGVPDINDMPRCACCRRPYYPVTDISGHQMCSWCGHYVKYRDRWFLQKHFKLF